MAPSTGWRLRYSICSFSIVSLLLTFVPYTECMRLGMSMHRFCVPHDTNPGYIVTKVLPDPRCLEMNHISKDSGKLANPFHIQDNGYLVTNTSLVDRLQDIFIVKTSPNCENMPISPVSDSSQIHIEIVSVGGSLSFVHDKYVGTVFKNAKIGTLVDGLTDLFACDRHHCDDDVKYSLQGSESSHFYLRTVNHDGQQSLQILTDGSLQNVREGTLNFIIAAQNAAGLEGHTNLEIIIKENDLNPKMLSTDMILQDQNLRFQHHRQKRQTPELRPTQTFPETKTGILFSVDDPPNPNWEYSLKSSTLENMFQVSTNGQVSLATGAKFDYEDPNKRTATLVITASQNNIVVKDIQFEISITDVNDEAPKFTNQPFPYLAVARNTDSLIYTLTAMDPDAGADLELRGDLTPDQQNLFTVTFIRPNKAEIRTTSVRLTADQEYTLRVEARDNNAPGTSTQRAFAEVLVKAGDRAPQFGQQSYIVTFQEDTDVDIPITTQPFSVTSFQGNAITLSVLDSPSSTQTSTDFGVRPDRHLFAKRKMDYENADDREFSLTLRATESVTNYVTDVSLTVRLTDWNEEPPKFPLSSYEKTFPENVPEGTSLLDVSAEDGDYNQRLSFSVDDDHFRADTVVQTANGATAVIRVNKPLDFDRISPKMYDFNVTATDDGVVPQRRSGSTVVRIVVTDVNDEYPQFPVNETAGEFMTANIRYDLDVNEIVYILQASDADSGDKVSYQLSPANQFNNLFNLNSQEGSITLARKIADQQDQITDFKYELRVVATDDGGCCGRVNTNPTTGTVTINILTDNDMSPKFDTCGDYEPSVDENSADAFVIKVYARDDDYGSNGEVTYSIRPNQFSDNFRINATTGDLYTAKEIDREALVGTTTVPINIDARDGGNSVGTCPLLVKINDVNDNKPIFTSDQYTFNIKNDLDVGSQAFQVQATDNDIGQNADVIYSFISNPDGYFKFDEQTRLTGSVRVNRTLPQEERTITLEIQAKDNGTFVQLNSTALVIVHFVKNQNQLPPQWQGGNNDYTRRYSESVAVPTNLMPLRAVSQLDNKQLSFSIVGDTAVQELFEINIGNIEGDVSTGTLINRKSLDYETATSYQISVRASDTGTGYADQIVTIILEDANDNRPSFLGTNNRGWLELSLNEGNYSQVPLPGEVVAQLRATDLDRTAPFNEIKEFRIKNSDGTFTIDSSSGILYTRSTFDRESVPKNIPLVKTLIVEAIDNAPSSLPNTNSGPNTGQATVKITIKDVNDNAPAFGQESYTFRVKEDKLPGTTVATLTAVDPDSDAILEYRRTPTTPFSIQQTTGAIQVQGQLDFDEGTKEYSFRVIVSDQVHEGTCQVTIILEDVNDNPPQINSYTFNDFVENSTDVVRVIQTVNASDIDNGGINTFYYSLKFTDELTKQYFAIDQRSGNLSITQPLDRDYPNGKAEFTFTIEVADAPEGQNPLYGRNTVTLRPIDINDNVPFFPADKAHLSVLENQTAVPVQVGRVVVTDYDAGVNAEVELSILSQGPGDNFRLNDRTGFIETTQVLDREVEDTYFILMQAVDKGSPRLTGTGTLTITVQDINDNAPYFMVDRYEFTMSEKTKDGGTVGVIQANDSDIGINAALTYSLDVNDRSYFAMSSVDNQGRLSIFSEVDYDELTGSQRSFNLTAYAQDSNPGVNFENRAQTSIHVIVTDYNDEIPKFDEPQIRDDVDENFPIGGLLATFHATDKDVNPQYNEFEYFIEQKSDPLRQFAIDQNGRVTLRHSLDRETTEFHTIHILAIDNPRSMPQNTGTATLFLTVLDINDNAPDFSQPYNPSIMENQDYVATEVQKFTAKDADSSDNGPPFKFELVCSESPSSQCSDFSLSFQQNLDNGNGEGTISVTGRFDREQESVISLPIRMCDKHNLCAVRFMDVKINDENDNPHEPGYQFILVNNYKGLFGDIPIGEVNVEDPDAANDDKTFELITPEAAVFVEVAPRTGIITLKPKVPEMSFRFSVRVTNATGGAKESVVKVQVQFISEDAVYSSGSIKIDGITDKDFLLRPKRAGATSLDDSAYDESMYEKFRRLLADKLDTDISNVFVHGVMSDPTKGDSVTVFYSAHGSPWYQSSKMSGIVSTNKNDAILGNDGTIDMVPVDMCRQENCEGGCYNELVVTDTPRLVNTRGASFVGVNSEIKGQCGCRATTFPTNIDCTPGYCYHGGTCVKDRWNVISCECPDGFEGPRCQQLRHSFNGTGYALYKQLEQCRNSRTSIEILTNKANGLILYNGPVEVLGQTDQTDFILLELVAGRPRLRINHGTGELALTIPGSKQLNDGTWHRIDIHRKSKEVRLVIDQGQDAEFDSEGNEDRSKVEATGVTPGENVYINTDTLLHLGGGSWTSLAYPANVMSERFDGCMKNLIHNAELYDLSTGDTFPGSSDGCKREDDACGISCGNGQCLITGVQKHICDCDPGYRTSNQQTSGTAVTCNTETTKRDFKDESYMDWALKAGFKSMLNSRRTSISFRYRSRDDDGLLFSVVDETQSSKYIKLKILGGLLQATYNLGDGPVRVSLSNVPANDGQWHQVTVQRVGKELTLKMDSGEGRYYAEFQGPENGNLDLSIRQTEIHSGANLFYSSGQPSIFVGNEEDFNSSCINDIRLDRYWFPMKDEEEQQSFAATVGAIVNTQEGCVREDCKGKCQQPFVCIPLWETYVCDCPDYYVRNVNAGCSLKDYCEDNLCVGDASCENLNPCKINSAECSSPPNNTKRYFSCKCTGDWYGDLCQCHPELGSGGEACYVPPVQSPVAAANVGLIVGILLAVVFLIVIILVIAFLLWRCYREPEEKEPFDDDPDDIRENIMYYDEEGAGEEDQTGYDLSRLRKPDDGEHARPWDAPDIPKSRAKPLGTTSDRPDIGDFINNRLDEADDDPNSPPYDTPVAFDYEGGNSSVGSLSSLNTSSSGDQDYDYLNEWGPKFAKLADMYNNYDETE